MEGESRVENQSTIDRLVQSTMKFLGEKAVASRFAKMDRAKLDKELRLILAKSEYAISAYQKLYSKIPVSLAESADKSFVAFCIIKGGSREFMNLYAMADLRNGKMNNLAEYFQKTKFPNNKERELIDLGLTMYSIRYQHLEGGKENLLRNVPLGLGLLNVTRLLRRQSLIPSYSDLYTLDGNIRATFFPPESKSPTPKLIPQSQAV